MQRYKIIHQTYYNFSDLVRFGPHQLRLRPRENHQLHVESFSLNITPPASLLWQLDVEGNSVAIASFGVAATQLAIESEVIIQQFNEKPLDFLVTDYAVNYPFAYLPDERVLLLPYMQFPDLQTNNRLIDWTADLWRPGQQIQTYTLLQRLSTHISQTFSYQIREEPGVQNPIQTLTNGSGSCRDFAVLFMETARCLGLAARFVSGYLHSPPSVTNYGATHAWVDVYLPGAGWKGFDPTSGDIVGSDHIAVAVARLPESVPPIAGSFFGKAESILDVGVWVTLC
jgi:transglutaminase-like putative cysteine protease